MINRTSWKGKREILERIKRLISFSVKQYRHLFSERHSFLEKNPNFEISFAKKVWLPFVEDISFKI
jgi:hypothetical protein